MYTKTIVKTYSLAERSQRGEQLLARYTASRLLEMFQAVGVFGQPDQRYQRKELIQQLGVTAQYLRLFDAIIDILDRQLLVTVDQEEIVSTQAIDTTANEVALLNDKQWSLLQYDDEIVDYAQDTIKLLDACFPFFLEILNGNKNYLEVMFPDGDISLVAAIYQGGIQPYISNLVGNVIDHQVGEQLTQNSEVHVLEVGAGIGGTTETILKNITADASQIHYWYTDISAGFTRVGKRKFGKQYPYLKFKRLDIAKDPLEQGFAPGSMDIIVCNNVLHTTHNIADTIRHAAVLQKPGGILVINDLTQRLDFNTATFGLTKDWWNYTDDHVRVPHSPVVDTTGWQGTLSMLGYNDLTIHGIPGQTIREYRQSVIVARRT